MDEFALIRTFFARQPVERAEVILGVGDDGAILTLPRGMELVVATDTLNAGIHFPDTTDPGSVGHKALAVNLSDLAAMGAAPAWFTLNLSLPQVDPAWLEAFCTGLFALARTHAVALIGGDTTRGPLSITVTAGGFVPSGQALRRTGARVGDKIYITGTLGDAALGLAQLQGAHTIADERDRAFVIDRLNRPLPRVAAGLGLRGLASACIDVSDGLVADLGHILEASHVGASLRLDHLPLSPPVAGLPSEADAWNLALTNGDDYELCFTVPPDKERMLNAVLPRLGCPCTAVGEIEVQPGLRLVDAAGRPFTVFRHGYNHFANPA